MAGFKNLVNGTFTMAQYVHITADFIAKVSDQDIYTLLTAFPMRPFLSVYCSVGIIPKLSHECEVGLELEARDGLGKSPRL